MTNHPNEDIAGYVLGTLEHEERVAVEQHLGQCSICRLESARLAEVVGQLSFAPDPFAAPPLLKNRVIRTIVEAPAPVAVVQKGNVWRNPAAVLAIAASLLALITGASLVSTLQTLNRMNDDLGTLRQQMTDQAAALQVLSSANSKLSVLPASAEVPSADARIVFDPTGHRALIGVSSFPKIEPDMAFQIWLWRGTERISTAVFTVDQSGAQTVSIWAKDDLSSYDGMGVTVEPKGGSTWPTGQRVVGGRF